jgi:SnoaL-like domain
MISSGLTFAVHTRGKDKKMSDQLAGLMLRNLQEVFNERDPARRIGAVKSIYAKEAEFFEGDERIKGHDAISAKVSALQASFPPDFTFSPTGAPASNHDLGRLTWRVGPAGGSPAATGMDVAIFERGRIRTLYTFVDDVVRP